MELNYIWFAILINALIVYCLPKIITKPTGVKTIDDILLYLNSQKDFTLSSSFVIACVVYLTHCAVEYCQEGASTDVKSFGTPEF